jgi:hypothetical protein
MKTISQEYRKEVVGGRFCRYDVEGRLHEVVDRFTAEGWELVWTERSPKIHQYKLQFKRTTSHEESRWSA